ncbi:hypothetical protein [Lonsdalea quercina]|uniref:hypothetical protein n=1 Tax=Lonsdalea quercina TaxID=71657 RepID=UPI003976CF01
MQLRALTYKFYDMGPVEARRPACQHAGAQFYNHRLAATHNFSAIALYKKDDDEENVVTGETRYANRHNAKKTDTGA